MRIAVVWVMASVAMADAAESKKKPPSRKPPSGAKASASKKKPAAPKTGASKTKAPTRKPAPAKKPAPKEPTQDKKGAAKELFADFLHYVKIGKFLEANQNAAKLLTLLERKETTPERLLELSEEYADSVETLLIILSRQELGRLSTDKLRTDRLAKLETDLRENARQILEAINEGRRIRRRDGNRIKADIAALAGPPQQLLNATERLRWSGEYAAPWMIAALRDAAQSSLHPRIIKALPKLGLRAVTPLAMALRADDDVLRVTVIEALGQIGYTHALPYLKDVAQNDEIGKNIREAAAAAITRIDADNTVGSKSAAQLFYELANRYYANEGSIRADPREDEANIWYWRNDWVENDRVPREIYDEIMAMRCCEEALRLQPDHKEAEALWLSANFRREAQLGVADIANEQPDKACKRDATRPDGYPRAIYFARSAGPRFNHMVLDRALADYDPSVALGAITALAETAGESSLVGTQDVKQPLVEALTFPDPVVRVGAALALGRALPKTRFAGSQEVIPVLAHALNMTGQPNFLVIAPDNDDLNAVMGALRQAGCRVVGEGTFAKAGARAAKELPTLDACFLASNLTKPSPEAALAELRKQPGGKNLPVIILVKTGHMAMAERITREDQGTGRVLVSHPKERLLQEWRAVNRRAGRLELNPDVAFGLALASVGALRGIAVGNSRVYDVGRAEAALVEALGHEEDDLRVLAAQTLARIPSASAQQAIAKQALDGGNDEELRIAMFAALAESGRSNGGKLDDAQLNALVQIVLKEKNLSIRTAASQAFGALNVPGNRASDIIRDQYEG